MAQTILALPYIIALTPAAIQGLPPGLLAQARILGAGRRHLSVLALREAKIGVLAAIIAALGASLSEVGAVIIVGGNIQNYDQTLASAVVQQVNDYTNYPYAVGISLVLLGLIVLLIGHPHDHPAAIRRTAPALPDRLRDMNLLWQVLQRAVPLIAHGDPYLFSVIWFTIQVAAIATAAAAVIGLPIGLAIGLGRFRGRGILQILANASLALPPVVVGLFLFLLFVPQGPLGSLHLTITRRAVFIAQTVLAIPYVVALSAAAVQGLPGGLVAQARLLGAGRLQVSTLALREARIGIVAALLAALGTGLAEVGAIVLVGGNVYGYDQTLASAALYEANAAHYDEAVAISIVLTALIVLVMVTAGLLQHQGGGIRMRFRSSTGAA